MAKRKPRNSADFIQPLLVNDLSGRVLCLPARKKTKKREILLIYGHHASIERMFSLADELSRYGNVTLPDLPGFGGMETFYKIGEKPTLDNMADYLASFVKMRYKRRRVSIVGISYGFLVATRMLQRYPELSKKVDILTSIVGFAHKDDFRFKRRNYLLFRYGARLFSKRFPAWLVKTFILRGIFIRAAYTLVADKHVKMKDATREEREKRIKFEIVLWKCNDVRTYMATTVTMMKINLCTKKVDLPVYHVAVNNDQYFDNDKVEQHFSEIFTEVHVLKTKLTAHMPTVIATAKEVAPFIPPKLRRVLSKS